MNIPLTVPHFIAAILIGTALTIALCFVLTALFGSDKEKPTHQFCHKCGECQPNDNMLYAQDALKQSTNVKAQQLNIELPKHLKIIETNIKTAIAKGQSGTFIHIYEDEYHLNMAEPIHQYLTRYGYTVSYCEPLGTYQRINISWNNPNPSTTGLNPYGKNGDLV